METYFARAARAVPLTSNQLQLVIGSLLGDGTLLETTAGYCFRAHHCLAQKPLVQWKYEHLSNFVRTPPKQSGSAYFFRTITHPEFTRLRSIFYCGRKKIVPGGYLYEHLSALGIALWIMDDGSADGGSVRLNTQGSTCNKYSA